MERCNITKPLDICNIEVSDIEFNKSLSVSSSTTSIKKNI